MTWHIIGAGAIGSLWADRFHQQGEEIRLILRTEAQVQHFKDQGSRLLIEEKSNVSTVPCFASTTAEINTPITHLLIPTKAFDAMDAVKSIQSKLAPNATIIVMINGYGVQQQIEKHFSHYNLLFASTTDGAYKTAPFKTVKAAIGKTLIGSLSRSQSIKTSPLVDAKLTDAIDDVIWKKVAINCCINPITAINNCLNGAIFATNERSHTVFQLAEEIESLERAMGIKRQKPLLQEVEQVAELTASNRSSMLQDVSNERRTEVEHINGAIVDLAKNHGVEVPYNLKMLNTIQNLTLAAR